MRPLRLELEGFSTFRERARLDFDGLDLVAFTGATGAGKSTLIDAITFALFGSVARYDNAGRVAPVIHQLANQARVRLDFSLGGRTYIATRVVRRRSTRGVADSASTKEARLELVDGADPDGPTTVLAGDVKELNAAVEDLLGLDFKQFTRTIVLPQGEFAAFLRDDPATRDRLLQRLLDLGVYERMGQLARSQARKSADQIEILADQLQRNPAATDEELAAMEDRVDALGRLRSHVDGTLATLVELDGTLGPLRERVTAIDDAIDRLATIEMPEAVPGLDRQLRHLADRREGLQQGLAAARRARDEAQAELDRLPDRGELERIVAVVEQLAGSAEKIERSRDAAAEQAETARRLADSLSVAQDAAAEAERALRTARLAVDAAGWTAALVVGEPCPVCHRAVEAVPDHDAAGEVAAAEAEHRRLASESASIATALATATGRQHAATEEVERLQERIDGFRDQLAAFGGSTDPGELAAAIDTIEQAERRHRATMTSMVEAEAALERVRAEETDLQATRRAAARELSACRDAVADLEPPALDHESLIADYEVLERWAEARTVELGAERSEVAAEGKRLAGERGRLVASLDEALVAAGIEAEPAAAAGAVAEATAEARAAVTAAEQRRSEHRRVAGQLAALEADQTLNNAIGRHLRVGGFGSWLLAEALDDIVAKATVWLLELSNHQYSLVAGDRTFAIIDHTNANETRDVRTLSGGETFLASLALALALADSIAELAPVDAPRLESMFLDEGFGTLDPATLDVVASAIEELASTGRMIGIVTHVSDLAERMPARFEVTKGPSTSAVELVEA